MNKEERERRIAEIKLKMQQEMERYEIQKNILNPIMATNNLENESNENKIIIANNYLKNHIYESEKRLKKIACINEEKNFLNIDEISFEWSQQEDTSGIWNKENNTLKINNIFLYECDFGDKFDEELIGVIQHEMIHAFISKNCNEFRMNVSTDASPIHQAIITFFNARGCNINSNGNLSNAFKIYQQKLYDLASNIEITFFVLLENLNKWQERLANKIEEYNECAKNLTNIIAFFDKSSEITYVNLEPNIPKEIMDCIADTVKKGFVKPTNFIELGMDCNLDNFEEFINKLIKKS